MSGKLAGLLCSDFLCKVGNQAFVILQDYSRHLKCNAADKVAALKAMKPHAPPRSPVC